MICLTLNTMSRAAAAELGNNRKLLAAYPENGLTSHTNLGMGHPSGMDTQNNRLEKFYSVPHLKGYAHPICLYSCQSIPCYKLLEAHFTISGNKMTITNKILTNQRRPYK